MPSAPAHRNEAIERARRMYAEGARVRDICAATGFSVGALYHWLDGETLPGLVPPRLPRRRQQEGHAIALPSRQRRKLAARLFRAAERQARKLEMTLTVGFQRLEHRAEDLAALRELARILRDLSAFEDAALRDARRGRASLEHEQALAVEGRAVYVSRTRQG
jgi:AcrR family transcriptional regulator